MADTYRVALSGDFKKPDGSLTFPDFDLEPLKNAPGVEVTFIEFGQSAARRAARGFRRADPPDPPLQCRQRAKERAAGRRGAVRRRL